MKFDSEVQNMTRDELIEELSHGYDITETFGYPNTEEGIQKLADDMLNKSVVFNRAIYKENDTSNSWLDKRSTIPAMNRVRKQYPYLFLRWEQDDEEGFFVQADNPMYDIWIDVDGDRVHEGPAAVAEYIESELKSILNESIILIKGIRRKPMKVSENLDNIISTQNKQISEPENAVEEQPPVYADAMRNLKKTGDLRDEKINDDIENATNHNFEIGKEKKLTLEESLFTEDSEEYIIYRVTTLLDDEEDSEDFEDM